MKIEISENTFKRLQRHAVPLVDKVEDVLLRLLEFYEEAKGSTTELPTKAKADTDSAVEPELKGLTEGLWELILKIQTKDFSLRDIYAREKTLQDRQPAGQELRPAIRAGLQKLRDLGYIELVDNQGQYRRLK